MRMAAVLECESHSIHRSPNGSSQGHRKGFGKEVDRGGLTLRTSESCAPRECRRSPLPRVWLVWRVGATRPPDLSNNRNTLDRRGRSHDRSRRGLCSHRADTSRPHLGFDQATVTVLSIICPCTLLQ